MAKPRIGIWRALSLRVPYSIIISAGIVSAVFAVFVGTVCRSTAAFDLQASLSAPAYLFTKAYHIAYPAVLLIALVALPLTRSSCWSRRGIAVLIGVPLGIYAIFGGGFALLIGHDTTSSCF